MCYPIQINATHDAQDCHTLQTIKEKREQLHEERRAAGACFNCGNIAHLSRKCPNNPRNGAGRGADSSGDKGEPAGDRGQGRGGKDWPPRGCDKPRVTVTKVLVDNGASLNLLSAKLGEKLLLPQEQMKPTDPFRGINTGVVQPMGRITLSVNFGSREAFRTEHVVFDVAHTPLPYKGIIGRPTLIKFMAATHCACGVMKMPSVYDVLSINGDLKDAA